MNEISLEAQNFAGVSSRMGIDFFEIYTAKFSELLINECCDILVQHKYEKPHQVEQIRSDLKNYFGVNHVFF